MEVRDFAASCDYLFAPDVHNEVGQPWLLGSLAKYNSLDSLKGVI